jgi:phospholipid-translocating ATPase
LYNGLLVLGYATIFTTGPVFSLVLDEDISEINALKFPQLYRELQKRRYLSMKTFLMWTWKAIYQSGVIMLGGVLLFEQVRILRNKYTSRMVSNQFDCCAFGSALSMWSRSLSPRSY